MRILWRVKRWWMFGSLTMFGRTLPIPQCPQYCISAYWGNMFSIWCSTCIARTRVLDMRYWRLQGIGKAPRASMLSSKMSIEWHQQVENWTLFQMQHSFFFDVARKSTVLQRYFHKFCDTPSTRPCQTKLSKISASHFFQTFLAFSDCYKMITYGVEKKCVDIALVNSEVNSSVIA